MGGRQQAEAEGSRREAVRGRHEMQRGRLAAWGVGILLNSVRTTYMSGFRDYLSAYDPPTRPHSARAPCLDASSHSILR